MQCAPRTIVICSAIATSARFVHRWSTRSASLPRNCSLGNDHASFDRAPAESRSEHGSAKAILLITAGRPDVGLPADVISATVGYRFAGRVTSRGYLANCGAACAPGRFAASRAIVCLHLCNWVAPPLRSPPSGSMSMCGQSLIEGPRCRSPYFVASPLSAVFHSVSLHAFRPASTT
jgi:hypothetical protein